jgi:YVTN family beta-propeller protein
LFAQNMMYRHSVTVYDRAGDLVATIDDRVRLADYGFPQYAGTVTGSPVEAVSTADGRYVYVSNYQMDGPGFTNPGNDECGPGDWDPSFVYRIDTKRLVIDQVIEVGSVPKYLALSADERRLLVTNWCSYDLSVVDVATAKEVRRVPLGPFPRGIAVDGPRKVAYVAVMGSTSIAVVDLASWDVTWMRDVGLSPRHLVSSPDGRSLYATLNGDGEVVRIDLARKAVTARVRTGDAPRSMAIAPDGQSLYVVNYNSGTVSKVRTGDMAVVQTLPVRSQPIGIAYDAASRTVWVAIYGGALLVLHDAAPG